TVFPFDTAALPAIATIVSVDGSQIVPDRHNPFVYYLVNIGGIVYHHGDGRAPETFTEPTLKFPEEHELEDSLFNDYASVTIKRDLGEIDMLAFQACESKQPDRPLLAVMDQRLLYVPTGEIAPHFKDEVVREWQEHMQRIQACGSLLAGYIDSPMKDSVVRMLRGIHPERKQDDPNDLGDWTGLTDADVFSRLLAPGERSKIFMDVSFANKRFLKNNQVCFFYLNSGRFGNNIARVDVPFWVARDATAVSQIHTLIYDQCQIMGNYPYVITRADEMAVVKRRDQEELEFRIGRKMDEYGVDATMSAKAQTKLYGRSDKQRHEGV
ncbi:MAG: DNA double-strand break repair nuclease NurA, partial [Anaerolineales bacterium]|nr:DNA double-strand break repair nuclease NurA [Anaerolineales bacterium]